MPRLFRTDVESDADLKVFFVDVRSEADLVIYETANQWEAVESAIWSYTDVRSDADRVIFLVDGRWNADLIVFRTDVASDAGWNDWSKSGLL